MVHGLKVAILDLKALVERLGRRIRVHEDSFLEELQQHFVESRQVHHRAVIALHELLDGERVAGVLVAKHLRDPDLVVEQQPVLGAACQNVQGEAHAPQECLAALQAPQLPGGQELVFDELVEGPDAEIPFRNPADHLDVAQPPGTALDVRLEVVARIMVAMVSGDLLAALLREEFPG